MEAQRKLFDEEISEDDYDRVCFDKDYSFQTGELVIVPKMPSGFQYGYISKIVDVGYCVYTYEPLHESRLWEVKIYHSEDKFSTSKFPPYKIGKISPVGHSSENNYRVDYCDLNDVCFDEDIARVSTNVICPTQTGGLEYCEIINFTEEKCKSKHKIEYVDVKYGTSTDSFPLKTMAVLYDSDYEKNVIFDCKEIAYINNKLHVGTLLKVIENFKERRYNVIPLISKSFIDDIDESKITRKNDFSNLKKSLIKVKDDMEEGDEYHYLINYAKEFDNENCVVMTNLSDTDDADDEWIKRHIMTFTVYGIYVLPQVKFKYPLD